MVSWKRVVTVVALVTAVAAPPYYLYLRRAAEARAKAAAPRGLVPRPYVRPPRPWRWPSEPEWVAQQVVRHMVSWTRCVDGETTVNVRVHRRKGDSDRVPPAALDVEIGPAGASRAFVVPLSTTHAWDPSAYGEIARALVGDAGVPGVDDSTLPGFADALAASDTASLRRGDALLFPALRARPRSASRHADAALLWAAHALAESEGPMADARPFQNGVTAHLALAAALRAGGPPPPAAIAAAGALDATLVRQVHAMRSGEELERLAPGGPWATALRLRVTGDARAQPRSPRAPRLVKVALVQALLRTRTCGEALATARQVRLDLAADWTRAALVVCSPLQYSHLYDGSFALQLADAALLVDARPSGPDATLERLLAAAAPGTFEAAKPSSIVPAAIRAEAGMRHLGAGFLDRVRLLHALAQPRQIQQLALDAEPFLARLPQRAVLDAALEFAGDPVTRDRRSGLTCQRLARLVADRPDLVSEGAWGSASRCRTENLLTMVYPDDWTGQLLVPGTGVLRPGPWAVGPIATGPTAEQAHAEAPWALSLTEPVLRQYAGTAPPAVVLSALEKVLDYSVPAMETALTNLHADDDAAERLARAVCDADVEKCARWAEHLCRLGRVETAEALWKRGLAKAKDEVALSNNVGSYVNLLLDTNRTREAVALARHAAATYSEAGLFTLAFTLERLGRFDDAAREYAKITERYASKDDENKFYLRYRQRHGDDRFAEEAQRAQAEVFPNGIRHKSLADFRREGHSGGVQMGVHNLWEALRRFGVRQGDYVVSVDGIAVESREQMSAALGFTDDPTLTMVVNRRVRPGEPEPPQGYVELTGPYSRWKYDPVGAASTVR